MSKNTFEIDLNRTSFSSIDNHFSDYLLSGNSLSGDYSTGNCDDADSNNFALIIKLLSKFTGDGNICLNIDKSCAGNSALLDAYDNLLKFPFVSIADNGAADLNKPLIAEGRNIYFQKYFYYENYIAGEIMKRSLKKIDIDEQLLLSSINDLYPAAAEDWQKIAAYNCADRLFSIITGGPGTGKTFTVFNILLLIIEQYFHKKSICRIAIAAQTGKASSHLLTSINSAKKIMLEKITANKISGKYADIMNNFPEESFTLHRLLNSVLYNDDSYSDIKYLPYDVIVIDESSMVDISLMYRFLTHVSGDTQLIMMGDKDQLASVEAGSVFADICDFGNHPKYTDDFYADIKRVFNIDIGDAFSKKRTGLQDSIIYLSKSYRVSSNSGIGALCAEINSCRGTEAVKMLKNPAYTDIEWVDYSAFTDKSGAIRTNDIAGYIYKVLEKNFVDSGYFDAVKNNDVNNIFDIISSFQILSPLRQSFFGVENLNEMIENSLFSNKRFFNKLPMYAGQQIIITENDYTYNLFNGDVGVVMRDNDEFFVYFKKNTGSENFSSVKYKPLQINKFENSFAVTVHKSQGSEYDTVLLVLPDKDNRLLTKELLYTAATRAKKKLIIMGTEEVFVRACDIRTERMSGLNNKLWGN